MKMFFRLFLVIGMTGFLACSKTSAPAVSVDGSYSFDAAKFMQNLGGTDDKMFQNMPKEMLDKMLEGLKTFTLEIKGNEATANFADVVVKGSLKKLESKDSSMRFLMTPNDEDKKDDTATLIIEGRNLTLDPGKDPTDRLFFSRN